MLTQADFKGQAYEVVKAFYPNVIQLKFQKEECHVTIQTQFFFNKDLEYLRYGNKGSRPALLISKMKAARYPNFGLELLVPEQMWIDEKFYIEKQDSLSHRREVRKHMRILSIVRIKAYSRYGYDYLSKILLRRADYQKYTIAEKDFKNLYPSDFEDLNLLLLQGHLDYLPGSDKRMPSTAVNLWTRNLVIRKRVKDFQLGIESYQTQLNLTKPGWDATGFEFKHDYTIIKSSRAVVFPVNNNERKIMRFNEIYKFNDGTLTRILEALDYRVKEFKIKRLNPGKLGDSDVHTLEDPTLILEILSRRFFLRLNLPDHRFNESSSIRFKASATLISKSSRSIKAKGTSRTTNNQTFTIKKGMSMPVQMPQAQDGKRPQVDDQRLDLADDLKEAQDHISSSSNSDTDKIMAQMDAMTMKMDAQYKEFQSHSKQLNPDHNDDDIPMSREEKAKFMQTFHRSSSKPYQPPQARNEHVNAVFTRSGKSYDPPINLNDQPDDSETPINFDSDDEDDEPIPQPKPKEPKPVKETPIPKPYKPKIPYTQRLRKEKMEAQYGKFLDMIRAV
ncbi:hypothetical protein Tco_1153089 [Tanacetum coccineum]